MRRILRWFGWGALGLVAATAIVFVAWPAARRAEDGAADPLLAVRRPIVELLRRVGLAPEPAFIAEDRWLPSSYGTESWTGERTPATVVCETSVEREPVYRGLLWRAGKRVTIEHDAAPGARGLRITYRVGEVDVLAAEGGRRVTGAAPVFERWRLTGYVPDEAVGWSAEIVAADGRVGGVLSWGIAPAKP